MSNLNNPIYQKLAQPIDSNNNNKNKENTYIKKRSMKQSEKKVHGEDEQKSIEQKSPSNLLTNNKVNTILGIYKKITKYHKPMSKQSIKKTLNLKNSYINKEKTLAYVLTGTKLASYSFEKIYKTLLKELTNPDKEDLNLYYYIKKLLKLKTDHQQNYHDFFELQDFFKLLCHNAIKSYSKITSQLIFLMIHIQNNPYENIPLKSILYYILNCEKKKTIAKNQKDFDLQIIPYIKNYKNIENVNINEILNNHVIPSYYQRFKLETNLSFANNNPFQNYTHQQNLPLDQSHLTKYSQLIQFSQNKTKSIFEYIVQKLTIASLRLQDNEKIQYETYTPYYKQQLKEQLIRKNIYNETIFEIVIKQIPFKLIQLDWVKQFYMVMVNNINNNNKTFTYPIIFKGKTSQTNEINDVQQLIQQVQREYLANNKFQFSIIKQFQTNEPNWDSLLFMTLYDLYNFLSENIDEQLCVTTIKNEIDKLQITIKEITKELQSIKEELQKQKQENQKLQLQQPIQQPNQKVTTFESNFPNKENIEEEKEKEFKKNTKTTPVITISKKQFNEEQNNEIKKLKEEIEMTYKQLNDQQIQIITLNDLNNQLIKANDDQKSEINELQKKLEVANKTQVSPKQKVSMEIEYGIITAENKNLLNTMNELEQKLKKKDNEITTLQKTLENTRIELRNRTFNYSDEIKKNEQLEQELTSYRNLGTGTIVYKLVQLLERELKPLYETSPNKKNTTEIEKKNNQLQKEQKEKMEKHFVDCREIYCKLIIQIVSQLKCKFTEIPTSCLILIKEQRDKYFFQNYKDMIFKLMMNDPNGVVNMLIELPNLYYISQNKTLKTQRCMIKIIKNTINCYKNLNLQLGQLSKNDVEQFVPIEQLNYAIGQGLIQ